MLRPTSNQTDEEETWDEEIESLETENAQLRSELDTYKRLYEQLLDRVTGLKTNSLFPAAL